LLPVAPNCGPRQATPTHEGLADPRRRQDRADIVDDIAQDNPLAAIRMDQLFEAAVGRLAEQHESYRLVYAVQADTVWSLALVHTARLWPPTRS
jgi:plasmid stabilization system protein ParE